MDGLYGSYCNNTCPSNCKTCNSDTSCSTCKDGFYRGRYKDLTGLLTYHDCRYACSVNFSKCSSFESCSECMPGKYGTACDFQCSKGCTNNVCTKSNGYCECTVGFIGFRCDICVSEIDGDNCSYGNYTL